MTGPAFPPSSGNPFSKGRMAASGIPTPVVLWIIFFCYATFMALIFQKLVLPSIPSLHAGHGLLTGDASYFHVVASSLADAIKQHGWQMWTLWPTPPAAMGNVGLLAALYVWFGYDPSLIIPVNAALHASGGLLIYLIARRLCPGDVGNVGGMIAAVLFVIFPSALNWYGQIHKDGYSTLGVLLVLYSWIWFIDQPGRLKDGAWLAVGNFAGILLIALVRPYSLNLLLVAASVFAAGMVLFAVITKKLKQQARLLGYALAVLVLLTVAASFTSKISLAKGGTVEVSSGTGIEAASLRPNTWSWQDSAWLPEKMERYVKAAARARASVIIFDYTAGSLVDREWMPNDLLSAVTYLPRSTEIAFFAPFPSTWFQSFSPVRLVGTLETAIWYLMIPGVILALYYRRSPPIILALLFASVFLVIYGFTTPNVGTLHRMRYPYLFIFILVGVLGWVHVFFARRSVGWVKTDAPEQCSEPPGLAEAACAAKFSGLSRRSVAKASLVVSVLTLLSYLGFFVRDAIMARWYGLGSELDVFFIAMMLPMFLVNVFCIPFGAAIIPVFTELREKASDATMQSVVSAWAFWINGFLALLCVAIYTLLPVLLPLMGWNFPPEKIAHASDLMRLTLPILFFSGMTILGNSLLNALGKFSLPAWLQAGVPVLTIIALLLFGQEFGVMAVAAGMLFGQIANLLFVALFLRKEGLSLYPRWPENGSAAREMLPQFIALAASAFFMNAAISVDSVMASGLDIGSVAALNLGNKVVLFITGIVGAGVATVMLPHFSAFMAQRRIVEARNELSFFLLLATLLSIPISIALYLLSDEIVRLAFEGGAFSANDGVAVSRVVKFGIIQLPFFTCNIILLKFAAASRHNGSIILVSLVGLCLNVVLNFVLMKHMGVAGISLATTLSMMTSVGLLSIIMRKFGHVAWLDLTRIFLSWLLYLTVMLCLHYYSYVGVFVAALAMVFLVAGSWRPYFAPSRFSGA